MRPFGRRLALATAFLGFHVASAFADIERRDPSRGGVDETLRLQVLLDRAGYSPGEIDGVSGDNTTRALQAYRDERGLSATAGPSDVLARLDAAAPGVTTLTEYTLSASDTDGPFTPDIPEDIEARASLEALDYRSVLERLGERFHASPDLLRQLNPDASLVAGSTLAVPNVGPFMLDRARPTGADATTPQAAGIEITVSKSSSALWARRDGQVLLFAPATTGSRHDPLPLGRWQVNGVSWLPEFHYNPDLFWDADPRDARATLPPGPNGPVGVAWIDLSLEHYGIHGTDEPGTVGHVSSHGCVRLTNWDVARLAGLVTHGTVVRFVE